MLKLEPVYTPVLGLTRSVFAAQGLRFDKQGVEHIPTSGGAVIAMNHVGYFDFTYAGYAALDRRRVIRFMAKQEVFDHPVSGPLMRGMKHIPVDRSAGAGAYRAATTALRAGELIGVFPEQTISRSFELRPFKAGAARMAQDAGVPLVPMIIWGSQRVWTKDHKKRLGRTRTPITLRVGAPIDVPADADVHAVTEQLRATMEQMLHEVQESYPPLTGADRKYLPARLGGTAPTPDEALRIEEVEQAEKARKRAERRAARTGRDVPPQA